MRCIVLLLIFIIGFQIPNYAQPYKIQDHVKRILFIGNSITYTGKYIEYIEAYLSIRYPEKNYEFINVGLPSETVSGLSESSHADGKFPRPDLHERLDRILTKTKPDLVLTCYGMNDGIYLPYDDNRFEKYKEGIDWMHDEVKKSGAIQIHITPPIYDERKGKAYANVLDIYSDWLLSKRYTANWNVIDIHDPMKKNLEAHRLLDATFAFSTDGIHPGDKGHFLMAKHILLGLGERELIKVNNSKSLFSAYQNGEQLLGYVQKRQKIMKNAWLTFVGHKRPNMPIALPIEKAKQKWNEIEKELQVLLKKE